VIVPYHSNWDIVDGVGGISIGTLGGKALRWGWGIAAQMRGGSGRRSMTRWEEDGSHHKPARTATRM